MLPLGTELPSFELPDVGGGCWSTSELDDRPLLVLFICAHCPYVKHVEPEIGRLQRDFGRPAADGAEPQLKILAISSNSVQTHPADGPEGLRAQAEQHGWTFPYIHDADQEIARTFRAACTPDPYLFAPASDGELRLVYRGQIDASRPGNDLPLDGSDLRAALTAIRTCQPIPTEQKPSIGCNIKWHPGSEPEWAC